MEGMSERKHFRLPTAEDFNKVAQAERLRTIFSSLVEHELEPPSIKKIQAMLIGNHITGPLSITRPRGDKKELKKITVQDSELEVDVHEAVKEAIEARKNVQFYVCEVDAL